MGFRTQPDTLMTYHRVGWSAGIPPPDRQRSRSNPREQQSSSASSSSSWVHGDASLPVLALPAPQVSEDSDTPRLMIENVKPVEIILPIAVGAPLLIRRDELVDNRPGCDRSQDPEDDVFQEALQATDEDAYEFEDEPADATTHHTPSRDPAVQRVARWLYFGTESEDASEEDGDA